MTLRQTSTQPYALLLRRTDAMLTELEALHLLQVTHVPASRRSELVALVADLPFEYEPRIGQRFTPTTAIDLVFDIQEGLFWLMTGAEPDDELLEVVNRTGRCRYVWAVDRGGIRRRIG